MTGGGDAVFLWSRLLLGVEVELLLQEVELVRLGVPLRDDQVLAGVLVKEVRVEVPWTAHAVVFTPVRYCPRLLSFSHIPISL